MSGARTGRRTFACRSARAIDIIPEAPAFPADHRPEPRARDAGNRISAIDLDAVVGRWRHTLSHRGCGETSLAPPIVVDPRWTER